MPYLSRLCGALLLTLPLLLHAGGKELTQEQCAGCHALNATEDLRSQRTAPPLHYAGNKFREEWLVRWLQQPERLRPAGYYPPTHTRSGPDGDQIDPTALSAHPAVDGDTAQQVAGYLMTLRSRDALVEQDTYQPGTVAMRMGMMDFRKFKGCDACHQDAADHGGISGPELYTAGQRLQPAFISSYIASPVAWDAQSMMPVMEMNDAAVHKLVHYLKAIGEQ